MPRQRARAVGMRARALRRASAATRHVKAVGIKRVEGVAVAHEQHGAASGLLRGVARAASACPRAHGIERNAHA
jgi:hypothetical protein